MRDGREGRWAAIAALGVAFVASACATEAESAQERSVVPADMQVIGERADRARLRGDENAPIRIVEISDFQCPYCRQFFSETYRKIDSAYVAPGIVQYLWVGYANPGHGRAWPAMAAGYCAGAVGKFWPMHDLLFEKQEEWGASPDPYEDFVGYAEQIDIDGPSFGACVRNSALAPLMLRDYTSVMRAGISSTPYFILADSVAIRGAADFGTFRSAMDTLMVLKGIDAAAYRSRAEGAESEGTQPQGAQPEGDGGS